MTFKHEVFKKYQIQAESKSDWLELYHGGEVGNLTVLKKNFKILSPKAKLKLPSTGSGKIGISTTTDKNVARRYSSAFGNKNILALYLKKNAKVHTINSQGKGIDEVMTDEELLDLQAKGYDAVYDVGSEEKEYRILNAKNVKTEISAKTIGVSESLQLPEIKWSYPTDKELLNEVHSEYAIEKLVNPNMNSYPTDKDYLGFMQSLKEVSKPERLDPKTLKGRHIWKSYDDLEKTVKSFGLPKKPETMLEAIKKGEPLPMPIVVKRRNGELEVLGGCTRSGIAALANQHITALVIDEKTANEKMADTIERYADKQGEEEKRQGAYQKMKDYYLHSKQRPKWINNDEQFYAYLAEYLYRRVAELRGLPERDWVTEKVKKGK